MHLTFNKKYNNKLHLYDQTEIELIIENVSDVGCVLKEVERECSFKIHCSKIP